MGDLAPGRTDTGSSIVESGKCRYIADADEDYSCPEDSGQVVEYQSVSEVFDAPTWFPELGDVVHFKGDWSIRCTVRMAE